MATFSIRWRLLFAVSDADKAQHQAQKVRKLISRAATAHVIGRYWKDDRLWECSLEVVAVDGSPVGNPWSVWGLGVDGSPQNFTGIFNAQKSGHSLFLSLEWASFDLIDSALPVIA